MLTVWIPPSAGLLAGKPDPVTVTALTEALVVGLVVIIRLIMVNVADAFMPASSVISMTCVPVVSVPEVIGTIKDADRLPPESKSIGYDTRGGPKVTPPNVM